MNTMTWNEKKLRDALEQVILAILESSDGNTKAMAQALALAKDALSQMKERA